MRGGSSRLAKRGIVAAVGGAVVLAVFVGYLVGERRGSAERAKVLEGIDTYQAVLTRARSEREGRPKLDARMQAAVDRTLGPSVEAVDSEVRRRLNRACEELGFAEFSVTTGTSVGRGTPAAKEFNRPNERKLRDEADFVEVQATVAATGRSDQVFRLLARLAAEPWTKRIESVRLDPNADGTSVRATVKLATIFLPGRTPKVPLVFDPAALASANRFGELFASNPFRLPPPPAPVAVAQVAPGSNAATSVAPPAAPGGLPVVPAPASPFPYGEWQVTGIVDGPSGPEVWLRHVPSGTALTLTPGTPVGELILRGVEYDFALFDAPGGSCRVQVGTNLTQRASGAR